VASTLTPPETREWATNHHGELGLAGRLHELRDGRILNSVVEAKGRRRISALVIGQPACERKGLAYR